MARGKGPKRGGGKRFAAESAEEIEARNARLAAFDEERARRRAEAADSDEEEAEEVGERVAGITLESDGNDNKGSADPNDPAMMTRKQREEHEKAAKAAAYRKRHEAGLTEEYKRDMAKLAEVRARREKQAAAKKEKEEDALRLEEERQKAAKAAGATGGDKEKKSKKSSKGPPKLDKITIKKMKPTQLKEALKERGQDIQGNAKTLQARLIKYEESR
mmetsp:Transcript_1680/g.2261  ORF Transcript_1680/g.2261 Transcript_1680/m.2261 type:complete len:218 (-) Transcript_1680:2141-2794(-)